MRLRQIVLTCAVAAISTGGCGGAAGPAQQTAAQPPAGAPPTARKAPVVDEYHGVKVADDPAAARVIVDPNAMAPGGGTSIDWYVPSPDGRRVAVSLSEGGSERGKIYDMLRVELSPNGAFNVPEFGTVKDAGLFRAMHAYSPYHYVKDGQAYPPVPFLTGANDPRVDPMHSRKMTARLQAAGARMVLLRTSAGSGHGIGSSLGERIEEDVDVYAFLFNQLQMSQAPGGDGKSR